LNYSSFWHGAAHGLNSLHLEEIRPFSFDEFVSPDICLRGSMWRREDWNYIKSRATFLICTFSFDLFRYFFEPNATEHNKIPVVNKNLSS